MENFNLLISTSRGNEGEACSEIWYLLGELGDKETIVDKTDVTGLIVAKTNLDPFLVVEKLREILRERPWDFRYTLKVTPIERSTNTDLKEIERVSTELASKVERNETFRVTVEKRHTNLSSRDIIEAAASNIDRRVDLENPNKILLVEVLGRFTGISVVKPNDILAVLKEKRSL